MDFCGSGKGLVNRRAKPEAEGHDVLTVESIEVKRWDQE